MQAQNTSQRVLFVGLMFMVALSARLLVISRAGAFLFAIAIVIFGLYVSFRMVERLVAAMWSLAGLLAARFFSEPEGAATHSKRLEGE